MHKPIIVPETQSLVQKEFQGCAVALPAGIVSQHVYQTLLLFLKEQSAVVAKPLYYNELEQLVFNPIYLMAKLMMTQGKYKPGDVARTFYMNGVASALISEYLMLNQIKEVNARLSLEAVASSPIALALEDAYRRDGKPDLSSQDANGNLNVVKNLQKYVSVAPTAKIFDSFIRANSGGSPWDVQDTADFSRQYTALVQFAAKGKGFPLSRSRRQEIMDQRALVLTAIASKWDESSPTVTGEMYDALSLAYAYALYLQLESDYDVNFPATPFQLKTDSWNQTVRMTSSKLSTYWSKVAAAPFSMDISLAVKLWEYEKDFFTDFLPTGSRLDDMNDLWSRYKSIFEQIENNDFSDLVSKALSRVATAYNATHLLPSAYQDELGKIVPSGDLSDPKKLINALIVSQPFKYEHADRNEVLNHIISKASDVTAAIDFFAQAVSLLSLNFQPDAQFMDVTKPIVFTPKPIVGTVSDPAMLSFQEVDPISILQQKYKISSEGGLITTQWIQYEAMLSPEFRSTYLKRALPTSPLFMWSASRPVPLASVLTAPFLPQPVPAAYTASRNRAIMSYDIATYQTMLDGSAFGVSNSEVLFNAASILASDEESFRLSVVDTMICTGRWFVKRDDQYALIQPSIPTIYGVPTQVFLDNQSQPGKFEPNHVKEIAVPRDQSTTYVFVLHDKYPKPMEQSWISWAPAASLNIQIPVNALDYATITHSRPDMTQIVVPEDLLLFSATAAPAPTGRRRPSDAPVSLKSAYSNAKQWTKPGGFFPVMLNLPHVLFDVWTPDVTRMEELIDRHRVIVAKRTHPVTRDVIMRGFFQDEVIMTDVLDWKAALVKQDPTPLDTVVQSDESIYSGLSDPKETPTSLNGAPSPGDKVMAPHSEVSARKAAADVSGASVPERISAVEGSPGLLSGTDQIKIAPLDPDTDPNPGGDSVTPIQGDSESKDSETPSQKDTSPAADPATKAAKKRYKRRNPKTQEWEYIELDPGQPVPSGFIPAEDKSDVSES